MKRRTRNRVKERTRKLKMYTQRTYLAEEQGLNKRNKNAVRHEKQVVHREMKPYLTGDTT